MSSALTQRAALLIAATALALSAVAVWRSNAAADCSCAEAASTPEAARAGARAAASVRPGMPDALRAAIPMTVNDLDERLIALEKKLESSTQREGGATPPDTAPDFPRYVSFTPPSRGVQIKQDESGSISVTNSDASLAYKVLLVEGRREDGSIDKIPLAMPPVGK